MIRINLIPHKRPKRSEKGQQSIAAGILILAGAAAAVFLGIHLPLQDEVSRDREANGKLIKKQKELETATKNYEKLEAAFNAATEQKEAIDRLRQARAVPAWMLFELSRILTKDGQPTMTKEMAKQVAEDSNRAWTQGWDPKHVWITAFEESNGKFRLEGGAQSDGDMTQLALRMQASMYFTGVLPQGGDETIERGTGVTYYKFVITGGVVY